MTAPTENPARHIGLHGIAWAGVMLAVLWAAGFVCFVHYVGSLVPPDDKIKTDAIVVLTGGANRINAGFDMLDRELAGKLLISGVGPNVSQENLLSRWRSDVKTPPCCITLGRLAHNTAQNAAETRQWAEKENVHSMRVVTAAYHMPRAWLEFHAAMPAAEILLCPAPPPREGYEKENFFLLAFSEYNKTLATWLRLYLWPGAENPA
jgi:uncharacterized SAM-binding protein YcdF (DUF218 family)